MTQLNITINGKQYQANEGEMILSVCQRNGIDIPTLCNQPELKPYGSCFICVVEIKGQKNLRPSCATPVTNGMEVQTDTDSVKASRKMCLELLLSDHTADCLAPCQSKCPAGLNIPGFISLMKEQSARESLALIKEAIPLPASLGRVCPRPCESECRRCSFDAPVSICFLKRYVADEDLFSDDPYIPQCAASTGKKVAIIGAGPGGLTAAFFLRKDGHSVDIFDSHEYPGGMLRYGIPSYRLPHEVLAAEIGIIEKMGVTIHCNKALGRDIKMADLKRDYDAVFVGIGAQSASSMRIAGEEEGGALPGIGFLDDVASGKKVNIGNDVVVVGGGNTAIDAARTSLRLGAKNVTILYRRTREEMPANDSEIEDAIHEGVKMKYLSAPTKMARLSDGTVELTCIEMGLGEPDASGRRRPVPKAGSEHVIKASVVISAIGQNVDPSCIDEIDKIKLTKWNSLDVNETTFQTSDPKVFAAGDCVTGADIAIGAIGAGHKAAIAIGQFLQGLPVEGIEKKFNSMMEKVTKHVPIEAIFKGEDKSERATMPTLPTKTRVTNFNEVEKGLTKEQAAGEMNRCMACGCRSTQSCKIRSLAIEYKADPTRFTGSSREYQTDDSHPQIFYEAHKCIMCGSCVRVCSEIKHLDALGFVGRGYKAVMMPALKKPWQKTTCDSCLKCVPMCPTGAISLKTTPAAQWKGEKESIDVSKVID